MMTEIHTCFRESLDCVVRPKRARIEPQKYTDIGNGIIPQKRLELHGILEVLKEYDSCAGGINCCICGKLYKSKVCFTKHLWEHSVYWDLFDGAKNHDRVLSIQAALILYQNSFTDFEESVLPVLLVTSPHDKKSRHETENTESPSSPKIKQEKHLKKFSSPNKKRKRHCSMEY
ncbi:uncharacterized protein LOC100366959 [Saccoglossus kowalevskii]|uniref:Uncharacterized protein LOC100366959 n=1 Tax=Saccoglossus kowalevskii TaxID=10224 RepID=A0ABM0M4P3_SACKO|nr:PREDICTED: uncharacterized protein LOC100366959 [Saccoglossus kowalevskii]